MLFCTLHLHFGHHLETDAVVCCRNLGCPQTIQVLACQTGCKGTPTPQAHRLGIACEVLRVGHIDGCIRSARRIDQQHAFALQIFERERFTFEGLGVEVVKRATAEEGWCQTLAMNEFQATRPVVPSTTTAAVAKVVVIVMHAEHMTATLFNPSFEPASSEQRGQTLSQTGLRRPVGVSPSRGNPEGASQQNHGCREMRHARLLPHHSRKAAAST